VHVLGGLTCGSMQVHGAIATSFSSIKQYGNNTVTIRANGQTIGTIRWRHTKRCKYALCRYLLHY